MTKHLTTVCLFLALSVSVFPAKLGAEPPERPRSTGLVVRTDFVRCRDADTIEVKIPGSAYVWALRLWDVWGPELDAANPDSKAIAKAGKAFVKDACENNPSLLVFIPFDNVGKQPLKALTFDRIPAWVWLDKSVLTLNEMVVMNGFASSEKHGELGK